MKNTSQTKSELYDLHSGTISIESREGSIPLSATTARPITSFLKLEQHVYFCSLQPCLFEYYGPETWRSDCSLWERVRSFCFIGFFIPFLALNYSFTHSIGSYL